jgi:hypothetical protein
MEMDRDRMVDAVCRIPLDFHRLRNVSVRNLLKASGYLEHPDAVGEPELAAFLRANPDVIEAWTALSEDKRVSEGWYLLSPATSFDGHHWVVGYYPEGKRFSSLDAAEACAYYIKREIESWR